MEKIEQNIRSLVGLYQFQTWDEAELGETREDNGVGFNAVDAPILTSFAKQVLDGKQLTEKQYALLASKIGKYRRQIESHGLSETAIPLTCTALRPSSSDSSADGFLEVKNGVLRFHPQVWPTKHIKQLKFRWDPDDKVWFTQPHLGVIRQVQEMFVCDLDDSVVDWVTKATSTGDLPDWVGDLPLFDYQREAVSFMLEKDRALLGLAPGLGKTLCSIVAAHEHGGIVLVVAPLSLLATWRKEIRKWVGVPVAIWHGDPANWDKLELDADGRGWIITNYETVTGKLMKRPDDYAELRWDKVVFTPKYKFDKISTLIVDETVLLKNRKAQRSQAIRSLAPYFKRVYLLSGAPTAKFYDDMWAQVNALYPKRFSSYWKFARAYCIIDSNQWGMRIVANYPDADVQIQSDLADLYFARTQDVLDLPEWIFEQVEVTLGDEQWKTYRQMQEEFVANLPDDQGKVLSTSILAQMTRLIQIASNPFLIAGEGLDHAAKWQAVLDMLDWVELPLIIWTEYIATAKQMQGELSQRGHRVGILTGETQPWDRERTVGMFQDGELDVIVAHPAVGKFGFTLTRARTAIYLERGFNGDNYYQSLHRFRRIGTEHSPVVYHMMAAGPKGETTIDHVIDKVLDFKRTSALKITSGIVRSVLRGED